MNKLVIVAVFDCVAERAGEETELPAVHFLKEVVQRLVGCLEFILPAGDLSFSKDGDELRGQLVEVFYGLLFPFLIVTGAVKEVGRFLNFGHGPDVPD